MVFSSSDVGFFNMWSKEVYFKNRDFERRGVYRLFFIFLGILDKLRTSWG